MSVLSKDIIVGDDPVAVDSATSVIMCESLKDIRDLDESQEEAARATLVVFDACLAEEVQLMLLESAVKNGHWFVLTPAAGFDFIRQASLKVLPRSVFHCHEAFRLFYVTSAVDTEALLQLPTLFRSGVIHVQAPLVRELDARRLCRAVENANEYEVSLHRSAVRYLTWHDQIALCRRCRDETSFLAILEFADVSAVDSEGFSMLDVALDKRYQKATQKICDLGGKSDLVDLPQLSGPETQHLLETIVNSENVPFDEVAATHVAATIGDREVLKALFNARLDKSFAYSDYPLATVILQGDADITQLIIDRMECVGLPPFRSAEISLYFLLEVLEGEIIHEGEKTQVLPPTDFQNVLQRFCQCIIEEGALPYVVSRRAIEVAMAACPSIVDQLLNIADVTKDPFLMMDLYLERLPQHPMALECLKAFMMLISPEGTERRELAKRIIYRGPEALELLPEALKFISNKDCLLDAQVTDGDDVVGEKEDSSGGTCVGRTFLMLACAYPGYPAAVEVLLQEGCNPNVKNEVGLNIIQQMVVSVTNNPLKHKERLNVYGEIFRLLVERGVETSVQGLKDFGVSTLLACAERLHLAPMCYHLLPQDVTAVREMFFTWPLNLRCGIVNYHLETRGASSTLPDNEAKTAHGCAVEDLVEVPWLPRRPEQTCSTLCPLSTQTLNHILRFMDGHTLLKFSRTTPYHYGLTCRSAFYMDQEEILKRGGGEAFCCPSPVFSGRALFVQLASGVSEHHWVEADDGGYVCFFTGETMTQS